MNKIGNFLNKHQQLKEVAVLMGASSALFVGGLDVGMLTMSALNKTPMTFRETMTYNCIIIPLKNVMATPKEKVQESVGVTVEQMPQEEPRSIVKAKNPVTSTLPQYFRM